MLHTTFALLHREGACAPGYKKLAKHLGGISKYGASTPIPLAEVLTSNGLDDALWCLRAVLDTEIATRDRLSRLLACDYAERALPIFEATYPDDNRPRQAIEVARRFADGQASPEELAAARDAAWAAAWDATDAARDAAYGAPAYPAEPLWQAERFKAYLMEVE